MREKCFYSGHNSDEMRIAITRPDGKKYHINFPKNEKTDHNILSWSKPMIDILTDMYYSEIEFNLLNNIGFDLEVRIKYDNTIVISDFDVYIRKNKLKTIKQNNEFVV
jgi:hypothetical protein